MTYTIKDHGLWALYSPEVPPVVIDDLPEGMAVLFSRRVGDEVDWYAYRADAANFTADGVVLVLVTQAGGVERVAAVQRAAHALFPGTGHLIEITAGIDPSVGDLQAAFGGKLFDPSTSSFADPPPPVPITYKGDIWRRCSDAEAETLEALLEQQPAKQRRLFNDATVVLHDDPLFALLTAGVTQALGAERAAAILAPST